MARHSLSLAVVTLLAVACASPTPDTRPGGDSASTVDARDARGARGGGTATPTGADTGAGSHVDTSRTALLDRADSAVAAIARRDWGALAALAHRERGVRLSPYGHVEPAGDCAVALTPDQIASLGADTTTRCWGHFDGSGEPIRMTFADYYDRFVHDRAYRDARRGAPDERIGQGNTLVNIPEAFGEGATFVEYHAPGTEEYGGMDWRSLRLVFVPEGGEWRLVGIVHDEWTI